MNPLELPISYTHQELKDLYRQARDENERLRADNKKLLEIIKETPCEYNSTLVGECLKSKSCCCALEDLDANGPTTGDR